MPPRTTRTAAALAAILAAGLAALALRPTAATNATLAAHTPAEIRTVTIRRTIHIVRHVPGPAGPGSSGAGARGGRLRSEQLLRPTRAARTRAVRRLPPGRWRRAPAGHMARQLALRPLAPARSRLAPAARTALALPTARQRAAPSQPAPAGPTAVLPRPRATRLRRVPVAADTVGATVAPAAMATAATTRRGGAAGPDRLTLGLLTLASFLAVLALLAWQLRMSATAPPSPAKMVRRVYQTTIVETVVGPSQRAGSSVTQSLQVQPRRPRRPREPRSQGDCGHE